MSGSEATLKGTPDGTGEFSRRLVYCITEQNEHQSRYTDLYRNPVQLQQSFSDHGFSRGNFPMKSRVLLMFGRTGTAAKTELLRP